MSALPFFQCQTGNHCGMHALNMHAGHDKFSKESMVVAAEALRDKYTTNGVAYEPRSTSLRMVIIVRNFLMHAGDLECVTGRSSSTPESRSSSVSKHIISLRSLRLSCATQNRRAPSLSGEVDWPFARHCGRFYGQGGACASEAGSRQRQRTRLAKAATLLMLLLLLNTVSSSSSRNR